jgi:homoserine O-acetyltransferase
MDYFDAALAYGEDDLVRALERLRARMLVLSFSSDWLFPPYQSQELADALLRAKRDVTHASIETPCGHDAFLLEIETEAPLIRAFLDATHRAAAEG